MSFVLYPAGTDAAAAQVALHQFGWLRCNDAQETEMVLAAFPRLRQPAVNNGTTVIGCLQALALLAENADCLPDATCRHHHAVI